MPSKGNEQIVVDGPVTQALKVLANEAWTNQGKPGALADLEDNWLVRGWVTEYAWRQVVREVAGRRYCARGFYIGVGEDSRIDIQVETGDPVGTELANPISMDVRSISEKYDGSLVAYPVDRLSVPLGDPGDLPYLIVGAIAQREGESRWVVKFTGAIRSQTALEKAPTLKTYSGPPPFKLLPLDWEPMETLLPLPEGRSWH
jgi:hypothetical protein